MLWIFLLCSVTESVFRVNLFKVLPIFNGLSGHDAQYLILNNVFSLNKGSNSIFKRLTMKATLNLVTMLEDGSDIYSHHDVNKSFNSFLIYFESCFPMHHTTTKLVNNSWIMQGIRISCKKKKKPSHT
jgi:hypothetical protein